MSNVPYSCCLKNQGCCFITLQILLSVADSRDHSPDEGLVEDLSVVDMKAVEQLTEGLVSHYLPDLQRSKLALKELTYVNIKRTCLPFCLFTSCTSSV